MTKRDFYRITMVAKRVRRLLLKKLGVEAAHSDLAGTAAIPLCAELKSKGYGGCIIVYGHIKVDNSGNGKPALRSHYWVELNGFVIDITGDQFNRMFKGQTIPQVMVAPYELLPRYMPGRKDCIKLQGNLEGFLKEWMDTLR